MATAQGQVEVLLVEDDPGEARLLRASLTGATVVDHVATLAAAISWLDGAAVDVVLLDLGLPDSVGLQTLSSLLDAHADVPVVVLSGNDDDTQARRAIEAGAQEYLVKGSVDPAVMRRTLRHAIERHRLQSDLRERAKEKAGLHRITRELHTGHDVEQVLAAVAGHLREAMQWPQVCHASVTVDGTTATTGPAPTGDLLEASVSLDGWNRGVVSVGYAEQRPYLLPHEQDLVDAVAETIQVWLARQDAVRHLSRSEERLRVLVSQVPGLVWTTDRDLRITSYDGALRAPLGLAADELIGTPVWDVIGSDDSSDTRRYFDAALAGTSATFERRWRSRWWRNHLEPKRDDDGEVIGTVCLSLDVTEQKAGERALAETRARLQGIFDNASDGMILADDQGRYVDANPAACELTGYSHEELTRLHAWELGAAETDPRTGRAMWEQFRADGAMQGDFILARKDGSWVHTEFRAVADVVPGVHLSVIRDITSRKRAEAALADSERRFRAMSEAAQDAIYRIRFDPEAVVEYMNPAVTAISGFEVDDFRADPGLYLDRAHPDDLALLHPASLGPDATETVTVRFRHADGHWIWLEDSRTAITEDGRTVGVQGVIRDVTARERTQQALRDALEAERRAAEHLRATDRIKSHFLQAVSHELRTPLTAVLGLSTTLVDQGSRLDGRQAAYFQERILANARRLDRLLGDLLDLEQLEHGTMRLDRRDTDLNELVRRVASEIEFGDRLLFVDETPVTGFVDPNRVERIVHNLLTNAVKHTPPGTRVTVECSADDHEATIEVTDDGPGIPEDLAEDLFEPFRQGPRAYESASPGTGIGLSIVRQFAALHGGRATVRTSPSGGAAFTVRLPTNEQVAAPTAPDGAGLLGHAAQQRDLSDDRA